MYLNQGNYNYFQRFYLYSINLLLVSMCYKSSYILRFLFILGFGKIGVLQNVELLNLMNFCFRFPNIFAPPRTMANEPTWDTDSDIYSGAPLPLQT